MDKFLFTLGLLSLLSINEALRVMVFFPLPSRSHSILGQGVVSRLLEAGHEVVHITFFPRDEPNANLTEINVEVIAEKYKKPELIEQMKLRNTIGKGNIGDSLFFLYFAYDMHKQTLEHGQVMNLLTDATEVFDAVIVEWFFFYATAGIAPLLQCPLIWLGSTEAHWQILKVIDEIPNPSYAVDIFAAVTPPLSFWERSLELWTVLKKSIMLKFLVEPYEKSLYTEVLLELASKRGVTMPSYEAAIYNASLMLINSHPSIGMPLRLPQNAKYIAGYHISSQTQPLPQDLQKLMNESKHGVIYFSMGTNIKSADMSNDMKNSLLTLFGKLQQIIIWKFETDLVNVPSNVHLVKWAPQLSILAHSNLKVFITHGGLLSTTEAVHCAVPVIGIPVRADQHVNMKMVVQKGFGIHVPLVENIADGLGAAIEEILSNPSYKMKAKEVSLMYHDRPVPPGKELVYWVEHVVRTRGAIHLRSPALHVPLYQKMFLDLFALLVIIIVLLCFISRRLMRKCSKKENKAKVN